MLRFGLVVMVLGLAWPAQAADQSYEALEKSSVEVYDLLPTLRPFVRSCAMKKTYFRRLLCEALNERLKSQHQAKLYRYTVKATDAGPLTATFETQPKPALGLSIRGCLTCKDPLLPKAGGDITKGRFFLFKLPTAIKVKRGKYDLGDIEMGNYKVDLPEGMEEKKFRGDVEPFLRMDLLYHPVAGVTQVGKRFKYGVLTYELVGHRIYDKCSGTVYGAMPPMAGKYAVDKNDLTCPQNRPQKAIKVIKLPSKLPQRKVRAVMDAIVADLPACFNQFGIAGDAPVDIVVAPTGRVRFVKVVGKLAETPSAQCIERLVHNAQFPKFSGSDARLQWPFALRP